MFQDAMFRNSVWSRDDGEIILQDFASPDTPPWNGTQQNGRAPQELHLVSRFSTDSDGGDNNNNNNNNNNHNNHRFSDFSSSLHVSSPLSYLSRHVGRYARGRDSRSPPQRQQTAIAGTRQPVGRGVVPRIGSDDTQHKEKPHGQRHPNDTDTVALPGQPNMSLLRETLLVATICIAHLCVQAGIGQMLPIIKSVGSRFRVTNVHNLSSSIAGYDVAVGMAILAASRLGETLGHKRVFIAGLGWSAAWSVVVGASFYLTRPLFLISRVLQGLGAALVLPTGLGLLGEMRPAGTRRAVVFTLYAAMSPVGLVGGALAANVFDRFAWWPWTYWAFSITLAALGAIGCFTIPSAPGAGGTPSGAWAATLKLDIPGMVTSIMSLGLFGFAWSQAHTVGWQQSYLWIILILSVVLAALFVMIEAFYAPKPLIPYSALSSPEVSWILVGLGCGWSCFGIWIFYSWQFIERLRSTSPLWTTAYFAPMVAVGCFVAVTTRFILDRVGLHVAFCAAMLAMMIGALLASTMTVQQTYWDQLFIGVLLMAWGLYTSVPVATLMISRAVNRRHSDIATSLVGMVTYYSMGLGLSIAGTVERYVTGGRTTVSNRLRGYRAVFWTSFGLAGVGLVVCLVLTLALRSRRRKSVEDPCCECHWLCPSPYGGRSLQY